MKRVFIVTPALAKAKNGNGFTALRWHQFLSESYHVTTRTSWNNESCDLMIALHARRSAASVAAFHLTGKPVIVVLTGTDLYRDIHTDFSAQQSLNIAQHLVVLQAAGLEELSTLHQGKSSVIYQSSPRFASIAPRRKTFDLCFVGHLRQEKDPITVALATQMVQLPHLRLRMIGSQLEPELGEKLNRLAAQDPRLELLGGLSHGDALREIRRAQLLICSSVMEGGANVVIEAIRSGTPVLASRISGNRGMLGDDYPGYFELGNARQLAQLIERCHSEPAFMDRLAGHCEARSALFEPSLEKSNVLKLVDGLLKRIGMLD